jgi:hypothetical protein
VTDHDQLDQLIEAVTVDCYNDSEQATAFHTVFTEEVQFPTAALLLGSAVTVHEIDVGHDGQSLVARCASGTLDRWLALTDLEFPEDEVAAWLHAAYRRSLGLTPYPSAMPDGWRPDWL